MYFLGGGVKWCGNQPRCKISINNTLLNYLLINKIGKKYFMAWALKTSYQFCMKDGLACQYILSEVVLKIGTIIKIKIFYGYFEKVSSSGNI